MNNHIKRETEIKSCPKIRRIEVRQERRLASASLKKFYGRVK